MNGRRNKRLSNAAVGLIAIAVVAAAFYLAFAKSLPFGGDGYTLKAVFQDAQSVRAKSPVRVAGVEVGEVTGVEHLVDDEGNGLDAAVITMKIEDEGRPVREDATLQLRPRLFLEGNLFVDLRPGSPSAPELESGSVIPIEQTAVSVQLDQVLTSLQKPVRDDLQTFLHEFGTALCGDQDEQPQGACVAGSGGEGFREYFRTSPAANRYTAEVNEALLGTQPGDLAGFIRNFGDTVEALDRNQEQLKDLVTNLRVVTGSFAAERVALEQGIAELPGVLEVGRPALAKLNDDFPVLRAFAREALPGVRAADPALDDATPFIGQLRQLVSKPELRGLVADLRPTIPRLAQLAQATMPFLEEARALSSCFNGVVIPWSNMDVPSASDPSDVVYKETGYGIAGVAGESRSGDANGQWLRVLGGGGSNTISLPPAEGAPGGSEQFGVVPFDMIGAQPATQTSAKTPFRPDQPCENQDPPNLGTGPVPDPASAESSGVESTFAPGEAGEISQRYAGLFEEMMRADRLEEIGAIREARALRKSLVGELRAFLKNELPTYQEEISGLTGQDFDGIVGQREPSRAAKPGPAKPPKPPKPPGVEVAP